MNDILDLQEVNTMLSSYLEKSPDIGPRAVRCTICSKEGLRKYKINDTY